MVSTLSVALDAKATSVTATSPLLQATNKSQSVLNNPTRVNLDTYQDLKPATGKIAQTGYQGLKTVAEYDKYLSQYAVEYNFAKKRHVILERTLVAHLNGYTYVAYKTGYNYSNPEFYSPYNRQMWEQKYNLAPYNISYGNNGDYHLWMLLESGGICWGISDIGMNQAEIQGIPAVNI